MVVFYKADTRFSMVCLNCYLNGFPMFVLTRQIQGSLDSLLELLSKLLSHDYFFQGRYKVLWMVYIINYVNVLSSG